MAETPDILVRQRDFTPTAGFVRSTACDGRETRGRGAVASQPTPPAPPRAAKGRWGSTPPTKPWTWGRVTPGACFFSGTAAEPAKRAPGGPGSDAEATPAPRALRYRPCPGTAGPPRRRVLSASACRAAGPAWATGCAPRHGSDRFSVPQSAPAAAGSTRPPAPAAQRGRRPPAPRRQRPRSALGDLPDWAAATTG